MEAKTKEQPIAEIELLREEVAELEQRKIERRRAVELQTSLDDILIVICNVDIKGNITYVNKRFEEWSGYSREEVVGKSAFKLGMFSDQILKLLEERRKARLKGGPFRQLEGQFRCKDGKWIWVEIEGRVIKKWGLPVGFQLTSRDITERKRAEEGLRASEQNFRSSLDNSPLGVRIVSAEGEALYVNQATLDIYGYSSLEELEAVPRSTRYTLESYAAHQERKEKRKLGKFVPPHYEISIVRKDGEVRQLEVFRREVMWGGKTQFQVIYHDITEKKEAMCWLTT